MAWARILVEFSYAELDAATLRSLYFELPLHEWVVGSVAVGDRFCRMAWAPRYLLPAFNAAARVAGRAAEVVQSGRALDAPSG